MKTFFRIYRDHAFRLTLCNGAYFCLILPLLLLLYICVNAYAGILVGDGSVADVLPGLGFFMALFSSGMSTGRVWIIISAVLSAILFGPAKFTLFRINICSYNGSYRFFADVLAVLRRKLPQVLLIGLLDLLVLGRAISNLCGIFSTGAPQLLAVLLRIFSLIVLLFWLSFRRWMYLFSASCSLRIWPILKNSFLMTVSALGKSSQCSAACALIWAVVFLTLPIVTVVLLPLCAYALTSLAAVCSLYPFVEKNVIRPEEE